MTRADIEGDELVVGVDAALVLDEVVGLHQLSDIVVVGTDPQQQRVGADGVGAGLGEVADRQRVLVGPRRLQRQLFEERQVLIRQLEQPDIGRDPEHPFEDGQKEGHDATASGPPTNADSGAERHSRRHLGKSPIELEDEHQHQDWRHPTTRPTRLSDRPVSLNAGSERSQPPRRPGRRPSPGNRRRA